MVTGFYGNYKVKIDTNGRFALPAKLRTPLPEDGGPANFILTMGLDGCLIIYPNKEWEKVMEKLETLDFTRSDFRNFSRQLYSSAVTVRPDRQGRMIAPPHLVDYAGLHEEVLVLGSNRWIEVWDSVKYKKYLGDYGQSYEEAAESLFPKSGPQ